MLDYDSIKRNIPEHFELILLDTVDSTNEYAKGLVKNGMLKDAVVIAKEQLKGKGTKGRSFYSPSGKGLYLSYLFHRNTTVEELPPITPLAAVAVKRAVERCFSLGVQIKWVNDIVVENKKLCGILTETVTNPSNNNVSVIIGIGVNIYMGEFPIEIKDKVTALSEYCHDIELNCFTFEIVNQIDLLLSSDISLEYMKEYKDSSSVIGKDISYMYNSECLTGKAVDIDEKGHLIVEVGNSHITLLSGDVSINTI